MPSMTELDFIVREAEVDDCRFFWEVNNVPSSREVFVSTDPIPWLEHASWYTERLTDLKTDLYIAETGGVRVGVVRFDHDDTDATISVALTPKYQGRGLGRRLIAEATQATLASGSKRRVIALVRSDNIKSRKAFEAAGYSVTDHDGLSRELVLVRYEMTG